MLASGQDGASVYDVSILIVTWKRDDLLVNCLMSLDKTYGVAPEVVVVDNANSPATHALAARFPNVKYVAATSNLGFAGGNNLGLPHCTRRYVLLLNNDVVVHEDSVSPLVDFLRDRPDVAVVQGRMNMPLRGNGLDACGILLSACGVLAERFANVPSAIGPVPNAPVLAAKGAFLLFDRNVLRSLDGVLFYDHFFNNHEETDFCHRVWLTGKKCTMSIRRRSITCAVRR